MAGLASETNPLARYQEFGWRSTDAPCAATYLLPSVLGLLAGLQRGTRILDVGCGNGFFAGKLSGLGFEVIGIDASEQGIEIASASYPNVRFEVLLAEGDLLDRLGDRPFDVVLSTEVIEHLYDPAEVVRTCFAALRPGGRLVCSTPYHGYFKNVALAVTNTFDRHWNPLETGGHIKFWSKRTVSELLIAAGFRDLEFRGSGRVPLFWKSMVLAARKPAGGGEP